MGYSWVSDKVTVLKSSIDGGYGTFATADIAAGELLILQGGRMLHISQVETDENLGFSYHGFQVDRYVYIYPMSNDESSLDGIFRVNHSCEPNCGIQGQVGLVTIRLVSAREEITFDYAMCDMDTGEDEIPWEPMKCFCHSRSCRGVVTGDDWKLPELQNRYRGFFSTYLMRIIERDRGAAGRA